MTTLLWTPSQDAVELDPTQPSERELEFNSYIAEHLFGQPEALEMAMAAYVAAVSPIPQTDGPLFTAMSLGGSRSGKSLLPRLFAKYFYGDPRCLVRVNLSTYKQPHQIMQLIGAPPSYVGFDKPVKMSRAYLEASRKGKKGPIFVVLEEIDKAHPDVADFFMGIYDNGVQELANGDEVDYRDVIFFMTSNLAADKIAQLGKPKVGFRKDDGHIPTPEEIKDCVYEALTKTYRPEFLNRIEHTVIYRELLRDDVRQITSQEVRLFQQHILDTVDSKLIFVLSVEDSAIDFMLEEAYKAVAKIDKTKHGHGSPVAELKRVISEYLKRPLTRELIKKTVRGGDFVTVSFVQGRDRLTFSNAKGTAPAEQADSGAATITEADGSASSVTSTSVPAAGVTSSTGSASTDKTSGATQTATQLRDDQVDETAIRQAVEGGAVSGEDAAAKLASRFIQPFAITFATTNDDDLAASTKMIVQALDKLGVARLSTLTDHNGALHTEDGIVRANVTTIKVAADGVTMVTLKELSPELQIQSLPFEI